MSDVIGRAAVAAGAAVVLASGAFAPVAAQAVAAATLYVSQTGLDSGTCTSSSPCRTVSFALTKAASGATIKVSGTIIDHLTIRSPVTITRWPGGPAGSRAVLDGTGGSQGVVYVGLNVTGVTLHDLTIENGSFSGGGGGISNFGTLTLTGSTVSGTVTGYAISNIHTMTVIDSTVADNSSFGIVNGGTMTVIASTVSGNAASSGVGIYGGQTATTTLGATIVAGNTGGNCGAAAPGTFRSAGYNLTSDKTGKACGFTNVHDRVNKNPLLGHLAFNGGPTKTLLPGAGGPADDVIPNPTTLAGVKVCPGTDQRGVARPGPSDTSCTIGAVEV